MVRESILQSEFKDYVESQNSNFKSKMNWFSFDEFWTMYPKMYWIKKIIMILDESENEVNKDEFKAKFNELYYVNLAELSLELFGANEHQDDSNNNNNSNNKPRLSIDIHNPNKNTNNSNNSNVKKTSKFIGNGINHNFGNMSNEFKEDYKSKQPNNGINGCTRWQHI